MVQSCSGTPKWDLDTPALCLDRPTLEQNIQRMAEFAQQAGIRVRPHIKTHKCPTIAWMQIRAGAIGITCAKVSEAEVMARAGITDILIANQVVGPTKVAHLVGLAAYTDVIATLDSVENAREISQEAVRRGRCLRAILEVDIGMRRCGVAPGQPALDLANAVAALPGLRLVGVMGYEGHLVALPDETQRRDLTRQALKLLTDTVDLLRGAGHEIEIVSSGGTGTYATTGSFPGITEIQSGSYATMDAKYGALDVPFQQAVTLLAQVVSAPTDDYVIIDSGHKTMTTEFGLPLVARPEGWQLASLSEEHGKLERHGGAPLKPGDRVELIPTHGCTTINLHDCFYVTQDDRFEAVWPIAARGRLQ